MQLYKTNNQRYLAGLFIIALIYCMFYIFFADRADTVLIPRKWRHVIKFLTTFIVYLVGSFHLGKQKNYWMLYLWHFVHISLLSTITCIGLYDWIFGMVRYQIKEIAASLQEFLISPILYIAMGILNRRLVKEFQN